MPKERAVCMKNRSETILGNEEHGEGTETARLRMLIGSLSEWIKINLTKDRRRYRIKERLVFFFF